MALLWGPEPRHSDSRSQELLFYETSQGKGGTAWWEAGCKEHFVRVRPCSLACGRRLRSLFVSLSSPPLSGRRQRDSEEGFWAHSPRSPEHFAGWGERGEEDGNPLPPPLQTSASCSLAHIPHSFKPGHSVPWRERNRVGGMERERRHAWLHFWKHIMKLQRVGRVTQPVLEIHPGTCSSLGFPHLDTAQEGISATSPGNSEVVLRSIGSAD